MRFCVPIYLLVKVFYTCKSKGGLTANVKLHFLSPPVNGLKDPWPVSCRCLEPRWFAGDPTSLARDNILSVCWVLELQPCPMGLKSSRSLDKLHHLRSRKNSSEYQIFSRFFLVFPPKHIAQSVFTHNHSHFHSWQWTYACHIPEGAQVHLKCTLAGHLSWMGGVLLP